MNPNQPYQQLPNQPTPQSTQTPQPATSAQPVQMVPGQSAPQIAQPMPQPAPYPNQPPQQFDQTQQLAQLQQQNQLQQLAQPQQPNQPQQKQSQQPQQRDNPTSTQATILISELRDNLVIMKDGSFRAVIACKSINFDLMSGSEREGVEYSYQNFLNSLNFTTQILIRSQRVDIAPYLQRLSDIRRNNDNMLLGVLMDDYINFIDLLSQEANIMDKAFFIIIPYYLSADMEKTVQQTKNFFATFSRSKTPTVTHIGREEYDKAISEINNRVETVVSGLFQMGIHSVRLNTEELSKLYYSFNNPDEAITQPFVNFSKMATTYVTRGERNAPQA